VARWNFEQYLNQSQICVMSKYSMLLKRSYGVENKIKITFNRTITDNICEHCISIENQQGFCFTNNGPLFTTIQYNIFW
jgi:hypothetical protein